jgi:hypothetical protein
MSALRAPRVTGTAGAVRAPRANGAPQEGMNQ